MSETVARDRTVADLVAWTIDYDRPIRWRAMKAEWIRQFGRRCPGCDREMTMRRVNGAEPSNFATVDHIKPRAAGGENDAWNLRVICLACNHEKGDRYDG